MNKVILSGRLVKDADLKFTPSKGTPVAQTVIAVDNYNSSTKEKGADFINLVVWGKQAERLATNSSKGKRVSVVGKLSTRSYEKDGNKRYITEVVVEDLELIDWVNSNSQENNSNNYDYSFEQPMDIGDAPF